MKRILFPVFFSLLLFGACAEKKETPTDAEPTDSEQPDSDDFFVVGPKPPDWGTCTGGWEQKEQVNEETDRLEARWCEPPANWRPVAPVDWGTCPEGWEQKEDKDEDGNLLARYCDPVLPVECGAGEMMVLGFAECQPVGEDCPASDFADIPVAAGSPVFEVAAGGSIQDAIDGAPDGAVISIGKGTFDEFVTIVDKNITLWGACVTETILASTTPMEDETTDATVKIEGTDPEKKVVVRNLTITGENRRGIIIQNGITGDFNNLVLTKAKRAGITVKNSTADLTRVLVQETLPGTSGRGHGVSIAGSLTTTLSQVSLMDNDGFGMGFSTDTEQKGTLVATDVLVSGSGDTGVGLYDNVSATLTDILVRNSEFWGLSAVTFGENEQLSLNATRIIIRDTNNGYGMALQNQENQIVGKVEANLEQVLIERNRLVGLSALTLAGASVEIKKMDDIIVRDTLSDSTTQDGGIGVFLMGDVSVKEEGGHRILIDNNIEQGLLAYTKGLETTMFLVLNDLAVRGTRLSESTWQFGQGIFIANHVVAAFSGVLLENNRTVGLHIATYEEDIEPGSSCEVNVSDMLVRTTLVEEVDQTGGYGVGVNGNVEVLFERALIEENRSAGIVVVTETAAANARVTGNSIIVRGTQPQKADELGGAGMSFANNVDVVMSKALVNENSAAGILTDTIVAGARVNFRAEDIIVRDTLARQEGTFGRGMNFQNNTEAAIIRAFVDNNREVGIFAASADANRTTLFAGTDLMVSDTRARASDKQKGNGIIIQNGARAIITDTAVVRNREVGLM
ncbi:MAG TPA: hypothetical protein PKH10_02920, partial [bacterium]|nr:hypothetical protein [bacterium]